MAEIVWKWLKMAEKAWMRYQTVAHSYKKLLWKFRQNPWTALDFTKLSHRAPSPNWRTSPSQQRLKKSKTFLIFFGITYFLSPFCPYTHFYKLGQPGKKCRPFSFKQSVISVTGDDEKAYLKKIWWEKLILGDDQGVMSRDMGWRFLIFCPSLNDGLGI